MILKALGYIHNDAHLIVIPLFSFVFISIDVSCDTHIFIIDWHAHCREIKSFRSAQQIDIIMCLSVEIEVVTLPLSAIHYTFWWWITILTAVPRNTEHVWLTRGNNISSLNLQNVKGQTLIEVRWSWSLGIVCPVEKWGALSLPVT